MGAGVGFGMGAGSGLGAIFGGGGKGGVGFTIIRIGCSSSSITTIGPSTNGALTTSNVLHSKATKVELNATTNPMRKNWNDLFLKSF